jgi:hypothetical protein
MQGSVTVKNRAMLVMHIYGEIFAQCTNVAIEVVHGYAALWQQQEQHCDWGMTVPCQC